MATISLHHTHPCKTCPIASACGDDNNCQSGDVSNRSHRIFHRKESLFHSDDDFIGLYVLRAGSAKSYINTEDGDEQIVTFHYPGDILGIDGFDTNKHAYNVKFLETSSVCFIGTKELNRVLAESPTMRTRLLKTMSHALVDENRMRMNLGKYNSEQRMAKFLLSLSQRFEQRGLSSHMFDLSMTRTEIANYLGMAIETISRLLGKFQQAGAIEVEHRQITICDENKLIQYLTGEELQTEKTTIRLANG